MKFDSVSLQVHFKFIKSECWLSLQYKAGCIKSLCFLFIDLTLIYPWKIIDKFITVSFNSHAFLVYYYYIPQGRGPLGVPCVVSRCDVGSRSFGSCGLQGLASVDWLCSAACCRCLYRLGSGDSEKHSKEPEAPMRLPNSFWSVLAVWFSWGRSLLLGLAFAIGSRCLVLQQCLGELYSSE